MVQKIQIKRSNSTGNTPTLDYGELGFNQADDLLFIGLSGGGTRSVKFSADTLSEILSEGNGAGANSINMESNKITNLTDGTNAQDAVTKSQLDAVSGGVDWKDSARAATDGSNVDLASTTDPNPIDGVTLSDGDRVLLKDQTDGSENGLYDAVTAADPTTWTRTSDMDEDSEVSGGQAVFIREGTANGDKGFIITSDDPVLGTDNIVFGQFTGLADVTAGDGLAKSGDTINAVAGDNSINMNTDSFSVNVDSSTIETDGTEGVRIASGAAGNGLTGGSGSGLAVGAGDGITVGTSEVEVSVDGTTIELSATDGTGVVQIASSAAGSGLTGGGGNALDVATGNTAEIATDAVQVARDATGVKTSNDLSTTPLTDTADGLNVAIDNDSIALDTNNALAVDNVDGGTF